jgi:hypothetical protein
VAEEFLDGACRCVASVVIGGFQEVGSKAVAEGAGTSPFGEFRRLGCGAHGFLQAAFPSVSLRTGVNVVAADDAAAQVHRIII